MRRRWNLNVRSVPPSSLSTRVKQRDVPAGPIRSRQSDDIPPEVLIAGPGLPSARQLDGELVAA